MIKPLYFFFFVIVCLLGLMACSAKPQDKFKNLTADEFDRLIQDEDVQRLDVRTVAEYSSRSRVLQKRTPEPECRTHPYQLRL